MIASGVVPNGCRPVPANAITAPQVNTSVAGVIGSPRSCSGAMKAGVPIRLPVSVRPVSASVALAMPKSITRGPNRESSTLPGLRSRCTTPARWIAVSALDMPMPRACSSEPESGPCSRTASPSVGPSTNSVTTNGCSASVSESRIGAVQNRATLLASPTSDRNRARNCGSDASCGRITLSATLRAAVWRAGVGAASAR